MANRVSIPAGKADPNSRYLRDALQTTVVSAQGGLTELTNLSTVARQLQTDPAFILKYFKRHLGVPTVRGTALRGQVDRGTLENALEAFIRAHILCAGCGLPEIDTRSVGPTGAARGRCAGCGGRPLAPLPG